NRCEGLNPQGSFWLARRYGTANVLTHVIGLRAKGFSQPKLLESLGLPDPARAERIPLGGALSPAPDGPGAPPGLTPTWFVRASNRSAWPRDWRRVGSLPRAAKGQTPISGRLLLPHSKCCQPRPAPERDAREVQGLLGGMPPLAARNRAKKPRSRNAS